MKRGSCSKGVSLIKRLWKCLTRDGDIETRLARIDGIGEELNRSREKARAMFEALEEERNTKNHLINTIDCMIWYKSLDGKYLAVNDKLRKELFYDMPEVDIVGRTDMEIVADIVEAVGKENHTFGQICSDSDGITLEANATCAFNEYGLIDGKFTRVKVVKTPFKNAAGRVIGTMGYGYNITEDYAFIESMADKVGDDTIKEELRRWNNKDLFELNMTCKV